MRRSDLSRLSIRPDSSGRIGGARGVPENPEGGRVGQELRFLQARTSDIIAVSLQPNYIE